MLLIQPGETLQAVLLQSMFDLLMFPMFFVVSNLRELPCRTEQGLIDRLSTVNDLIGRDEKRAVLSISTF